MESLLDRLDKDKVLQRECFAATRRYLEARRRGWGRRVWTLLFKVQKGVKSVEPYPDFGDARRSGVLSRQELGTLPYADSGDGQTIGTASLLDIAVSELWIQICSNRETANEKLAQAMRDVQNGLLNEANIWDSLLEWAFFRLENHLKEEKRKLSRSGRYYKSLRDSIHKSGAFAKDKEGKYYAPRGMPLNSPVFAAEEYSGFYDIPAFSGMPTAKELQEGFKKEYIVPMAEYFWKTFIESRCGGLPHYIAIYSLFCWMSEYYDFSSFKAFETTRKDGDEEDEEAEATPANRLAASVNTPEENNLLQEILDTASDFVGTLPEEVVTFYALYDPEGGVNLSEVAEKMGYKTASGASRLKNDLITRVRSHVSQYEEFSSAYADGRDLAQIFLNSVHEECKKRRAAPKE